jgi:hypothetical protein
MKKINIYKYLLGLCLSIGLIACDSGFEDINTNKVLPTSINPIYLLNNAIIQTSFPFGTVIYEVGVVQQLISPNSGVLTGANFNQDNRNATQELWQRYYRSVLQNTKDVINRVKDRPDRGNLLQMTRIWQAYAFMVLTDTYGDIPYSEAGKGFTDLIFLPKYDSQETIYNDLIKELTEASAALDAAKAIESGDVLYAGNVTKWKKLGYSLLLRAGMRLSKANATKAQQVVQTAVTGGLMASNADNCAIRHDANYNNGIGNVLNSTERSNFFLTKPFVTFLKNSNDPRLKSIAVRYVGAANGNDQTPAKASTDPALQIGMPLGNDNNGAATAATADGLVSFYDYSQADRARMLKLTAPMFLVTYAQTQLLLAEARVRGWITTGTATDYFNAGVRANMEQMADYDALSAIPSVDIDTYLAANPYASAGTEADQLKQINEQYWIASFLNGPEAFANFRRSGYPTLTPNPFPGKEITGNFIQRLTYPNSEISVNKANLDEAVGRMGADNLDTKVWWAK